MTRRPLAVAIALAGLAVPASASAATFTVTTTTDGTTCSGSTCTLRGAIAAAQANGAGVDDTIVVPAGLYGINTALNVTGTRITIDGAGANTTIIRPVDGGRVLVAGANSQLELREVTLRDGNAGSTAIGGNVLANLGASLTLRRVRLTNGRGQRGGGLAADGAATLTISQSLIDTNFAIGSSLADTGGGVYINGATSAMVVTIENSTITLNRARNGAGIGVQNNDGQPPTLRGVTLARNTATDVGAGGIYSESTTARLQGSILAHNVGTFVTGGSAPTFPSNCGLSPTAAIDQGGNVESDATCGLTASSRQNTDPQLAAGFDTGADPPVLALAATSPAVNLAACGSLVSDQRGVPRPQGPLCDAGAYELNPPPETSVDAAGPPFAFAASDPGSTFECSLDGGPFVPCASPWNEPVGPGTHTLVIRAIDPEGNADGTPETRVFEGPAATVQQQVTPVQVPTPVVNKTVVVKEISGRVRYRPRGSRTFVELTAAQGIPVGSTVDTKRGVVELTSVPKAGAAPQSAQFFDGIFLVTQSRGITDLKLTEALARCPKRGARAAAKKPKSRKLWGKGSGKFRTTGNYSAATVRGTEWLVQDSCAGTLTRVREGTVSVRDKVKKRTVLVRAGKRYLARPRR